ncbi:hypothetical protein BHU72_08550 [Desulfuribacillus stibiiarsenatis]|uniref:DUF2642 domain-containing protein n=1 Tax=Desulfuribacillus stibiiarsenatis TaxID=1390249 RepID=A0A1E5L3N7_9FIRM|nr:hypothetical protein [Desulfuribacillus stibiiarsenatis]OEH84549.1 hypothetical protein BHU72_08550 [Desulfuribacillus stibiiarsenatis]
MIGKPIEDYLVKIRLYQAGYKTTMIGTIQSWEGAKIVVYDIARRKYTISLHQVIRIEPIRTIVPDTEGDNRNQQSSLFEFMNKDDD